MRSSIPYCRSYTLENYFSLFIEQNISSTKIKMFLLKDPINTSDIPHTFETLQYFLPNVLTTECFNDQNLPFYQEVKKTEIGHLFEHILLEYLCQLKITKGFKSAVFYGRTKWNWDHDPRGLFHININCSLKDADILPLALDKSIKLTKIILQNNPPYSSLSAWCAPKSKTGFYLGIKNGKKLKRK